jgi:hypothetical protein
MLAVIVGGSRSTFLSTASTKPVPGSPRSSTTISSVGRSAAGIRSSSGAAAKSLGTTTCFPLSSTTALVTRPSPPAPVWITSTKGLFGSTLNVSRTDTGGPESRR